MSSSCSFTPPLEGWEVRKPDLELIKELSEQFSLSHPAALVMANRGMTVEKSNLFLDSSLASLTDPFRLPDMQKAVERIFQAIENKEKIIVHGDYDTDGVTSSTLLNWVLEAYGANTKVFISNRLDDGYGPTVSTMEKHAAQGVNLVISTDCGITSFEAAAYAAKANIDFIITDHHNPADTLPVAYAIVNPRICTKVLDLYSLAGVGVAFKVCHALLKHGSKDGLKPPVDLRSGLDLVALGTIADSCPLTGENRALVKNGLKLLNLNPRAGLRALYEATTLDSHITASDISRKISPKINAAGRVGDPMVSAKLLASQNIHEARQLVNQLKNFNRIRRNTEKSAYMEAFEIAKKQAKSNPPVLIIVGPNWHPGVIGLLSTKISKHFGIPSIVLSKDKDPNDLLGSGRSCNSINILESLKGCSSLLKSFGGHPMAVGLSLTNCDLEEFKTTFTSLLNTERHLCAPKGNPYLKFDGPLTFKELNPGFINDLERMEPFGSGNDAPIFLFRNLKITNSRHPISSVVSGLLVDEESLSFPFTYYSPYSTTDFEEHAEYDIIGTPYRSLEEQNCRILIQAIFKVEL
jgi:single-stranded-DNA-specific exonuclease